MKLPLVLQGLTQGACPGLCVCSSAGRIRPSGSVPSWVRYSSVMLECLEAPVLCHRVTLPGCAPGKGCYILPVRGPAKPRLCTGTAPLPQPLPCLDPRRAPVQSCRRSCCSACYHVWVFLSQRMTQIFVPGTCLHSRGGSGRSVRKRGWQHGAVRCLACPPRMAGPATRSRACARDSEGRLLILEQDLAGAPPGTGEPLRRDVPRLTQGGRGRPRCPAPKQVILGCLTPS